MELTEEQKAEIQGYIVTVPKYRETYNELYDHILNALADSKNEYSIAEVDLIVEKDFGGFREILDQEKTYHQEIGKKYNRQFRKEFIATLKWPGIVVFAFCTLIYYSSRATPFNIKPMLGSTIVCCMAVAVFGFTIISINRFKYSKYSILDNYLAFDCSFGLGGMGLFLQSVLNENVFNFGENGKLIAMLGLHFFCIIYIRTCIKIYKQKFKILTV